ncbi:MAG: ribbon-helix-helix domain-containing protein [Gaiellaceae bacterium MAG52_C11]|nr:ribbon-helix-helix domain-containing protein [Candidatus Gaiellasilicea maunaloa]
MSAGRVKKTSIYLEPELDAAIKHRAEVLGISKAEAIRRAVAREVGVRKQPRITAIGVGEGPGDVADNHDAYLAGMGED